MTRDAIEGSYANFRLVKTRSLCVIEIEIPVEASDHALQLLGGMPRPGSEVRVAIARLREPAEADPAPEAAGVPEPAKKPLRPSAMAGILCADPVFWKWLGVSDEDEAARVVRGKCDIGSRAELDVDTDAAAIFQKMRDRYLAWRQVA